MGYPIKLKDGTVVLAELKPGAQLTTQDEDILAEFIELLREKAEPVDPAWGERLKKAQKSRR